MHVRCMPRGLWTAVHGEVFGRRDCLQVLRIITLKARYESHTNAGGQIRILAIGLLTTAPAGIPEDVDVGRPDGETPVPISTTIGPHLLYVFRPKLRTDDVRRLVHQGRIPRCSHPNRLRENGGETCSGDPVQTL